MKKKLLCLPTCLQVLLLVVRKLLLRKSLSLFFSSLASPVMLFPPFSLSLPKCADRRRQKDCNAYHCPSLRRRERREKGKLSLAGLSICVYFVCAFVW